MTQKNGAWRKGREEEGAGACSPFLTIQRLRERCPRHQRRNIISPALLVGSLDETRYARFDEGTFITLLLSRRAAGVCAAQC